MRLSLVILTLALLMGAAPQEEKKSEPFDPFADPREELLRRAERSEKEKKFNELKAAAEELAELSQKMSDEIEEGGQEVISAKIWENLDRAENLIKTMRDKAK